MNVKVSIYTPAGLVGYSIFWVFFKRTGKMKEKRIKRTNKWHTRRGGGRLENSPSTEKNKNESAGHTHRFFFSSTTAQGNQIIIFNFVFCFFSSIQKMIIHRFLKNTHIIESQGEPPFKQLGDNVYHIINTRVCTILNVDLCCG